MSPCAKAPVVVCCHENLPVKSLHVPHERNAYTFVAGSTAVVFHLLRRLEQEKECLYAPVFQQASEWVNGDYAIGLSCDTIGLLWVGRKVPLTPSRAITKWAREFFADSVLFWLKKPSPKMEVAPQNGLRSPISRETHSIANRPHRPETQAPQ